MPRPTATEILSARPTHALGSNAFDELRQKRTRRAIGKQQGHLLVGLELNLARAISARAYLVAPSKAVTRIERLAPRRQHATLRGSWLGQRLDMRRVQAVVARSASIESFFPEVSENRAPTALACLRVVGHLFQRLPIAFCTLSVPL